MHIHAQLFLDLGIKVFHPQKLRSKWNDSTVDFINRKTYFRAAVTLSETFSCVILHRYIQSIVVKTCWCWRPRGNNHLPNVCIQLTPYKKENTFFRQNHPPFSVAGSIRKLARSLEYYKISFFDELIRIFYKRLSKSITCVLFRFVFASVTNFSSFYTRHTSADNILLSTAHKK